MKKITALAIMFVISTPAVAEIDISKIYSAHQAYDNAEYTKAIEIYNQEQDIDASGSAHYNLGNFFFKNNKLGEAIFHYKKAQELLPRDPNVEFNLQYARGKVTDKIENTRNGFWKNISLRRFVNAKEGLFLLAIVSLIFWLICIVMLYKKNEFFYWGHKISLVALLLLLIVVSKDHLSQNEFGVVSTSQEKVYSAIGKDNVVLFTLHEGAEYFIKDRVGKEWIQIELADSKRGWIRIAI